MQKIGCTGLPAGRRWRYRLTNHPASPLSLWKTSATVVVLRPVYDEQMATYAFGDIQGCTDALQRLLDRIKFDITADRLWFTGDLVNRGPDSAGTLRLIRALGSAATAVLGNHDLHLLAVAAGGRRGHNDTFDDVLQASDRDELLEWLLHRPLMHRDERIGWSMVHAGLAPQWTIQQAMAHAREAEITLRDPDRKLVFEQLYGDEPAIWSEGLSGMPRLRCIVNAFTRLRLCSTGGRMLLAFKGPPNGKPDGALPWFEMPNRRSRGHRIVFGHWSMLGKIHWPDSGVWGIDTGCLWGGHLSALCLETGDITSCRCPSYRKSRNSTN